MEESYSDPDFSIAMMADRFHVSIAYMSYLVRKEVGQNFSDHLWALRLERAKELLYSTSMSVDVCLKRVGIYDLFDNVWSCDDFGTTKSDPQIYHEVVKRLGINVDDAVFFDDNIDAIMVAAQTGLATVGVYDKSSDDYVEKFKMIADNYIFDFADLIK